MNELQILEVARESQGMLIMLSLCKLDSLAEGLACKDGRRDGLAHRRRVYQDGRLCFLSRRK